MNSAFDHAATLEAAGQLVDAEKAYRAVPPSDPKYAETCVNLGTILYNRGEMRDALLLYGVALEIYPDYALAHFNIANAFDSIKNAEKTLEHYLKAIELCPRYADAHYNLAIFYTQRGNAGRALKHFQIYKNIQPPDDAWSYFAKLEIKRLKAVSGLLLANTNTTPERTEDRAALTLV